VQAENQGF